MKKIHDYKKSQEKQSSLNIAASLLTRKLRKGISCKASGSYLASNPIHNSKSRISFKSINCFCYSENCWGQLKQTATASILLIERHVNGPFVPVETHIRLLSFVAVFNVSFFNNKLEKHLFSDISIIAIKKWYN